MGDFRKYACELSGQLFKNVNRKKVRREKLASDLGISVNQLKNYAYDSGKSATLENFLHVMIKYRCVDTLNIIAKDMGCCVALLPESGGGGAGTDAAADALAETAKAVAAFMDRGRTEENVASLINSAIQKLVSMERSL